MNDWKGFYEKRINSSYQDYFEVKYRPMLNYIKRQNNPFIQEIGCGIGSVSKALIKEGFDCQGFDLCPSMVALANSNVGKEIFSEGDIFTKTLFADCIPISHGVLEHFTDEQILSITKRAKHSIHYVPLDKHITPSFGDERLLPYQYWLNLVKPQEYFLFNQDKDMCFKI